MKQLLCIMLTFLLIAAAQIGFAQEELTGLTAREIVAQMGLGWNLGNTFDATGGSKSNVYSQETSWGNPKVNEATIQRLKEAGLQMEIVVDESIERTDKLAGKSIVISGVFAQHSRNEYKAMIEQHGGTNVSSISSKPSFILAGRDMGPAKLEKAQKMGVRLVPEEEFLQMLETAKS